MTPSPDAAARFASLCDRRYTRIKLLEHALDHWEAYGKMQYATPAERELAGIMEMTAKAMIQEEMEQL